MSNLTPEQQQKRAAAHAAAASSNATLWPNWCHAVPKAKPKPKKVRDSKTSRFKIARSFKAGHGRLS